jgi:ribose transport system permease protein
MSTRPRSDFSFARGVLTNGVTMVIVLYVILYAVYSHIEAGALSVSAFSDLVNNTIPLAIAAAGATFVILLGGFDLSVAGVLSLVNVVLATHPLDGASGALMSLLIAVGIGAAVGLCNGILVAYGGLQSIAVTLDDDSHARSCARRAGRTGRRRV